jgi:hypothetical protein
MKPSMTQRRVEDAARAKAEWDGLNKRTPTLADRVTDGSLSLSDAVRIETMRRTEPTLARLHEEGHLSLAEAYAIAASRAAPDPDPEPDPAVHPGTSSRKRVSTRRNRP